MTQEKRILACPTMRWLIWLRGFDERWKHR
jgi:hypothetical protein